MFTVQSVTRLALSQLSYQEGHNANGWDNIQKYSQQLPGFKWSDGQPWCATFAHWCLWQAAIDVPEGARSASCLTSVKAFKRVGRFTEYPVNGAIVFYGKNGGEHCGICVGWDQVHEHAVEGNTNTNGSAEGDGVYYKERERVADYVYGYGLPYYPHDKALTPDPHWSGKSLAR